MTCWWSEVNGIGRLVGIVMGLVVEGHQGWLVGRNWGVVGCGAGVVKGGWAWCCISRRWGLMVRWVGRRWLLVRWDWVGGVGRGVACQGGVVGAGGGRPKVLGRPLLLLLTRLRTRRHNPFTILGSKICVSRERVGCSMSSICSPLVGKTTGRQANISAQLVGVVDGLVGGARL